MYLQAGPTYQVPLPSPEAPQDPTHLLDDITFTTTNHWQLRLLSYITIITLCLVRHQSRDGNSEVMVGQAKVPGTKTSHKQPWGQATLLRWYPQACHRQPVRCPHRHLTRLTSSHRHHRRKDLRYNANIQSAVATQPAKGKYVTDYFLYCFHHLYLNSSAATTGTPKHKPSTPSRVRESSTSLPTSSVEDVTEHATSMHYSAELRQRALVIEFILPRLRRKRCTYEYAQGLRTVMHYPQQFASGYATRRAGSARWLHGCTMHHDNR